MALGTPPLGSSVVVLVGATSTPTAIVGGITDWTYSDDVATTTHDWYQMPSAVSVGKHSRTITLNCTYLSADAGQIVLFAAKASLATTWCMIKVDGTNGETLPTKVSSSPISGPGVNDYSTVSFTLVQQTDPAVVGTGFGA